jgi:hypothetical protein
MWSAAWLIEDIKGSYMQRIPLWLVGATFTVIGCDGGPASVDQSSDAVVAGVVVRASGSPVTSAVLSVLVVDSAAGETMFDESGGVTDSTGHFSMHLAAFLTAPFTGHVQITVQSTAAEQLADTVVDVGFVRFGGQPVDTSNTTITYP